MDLPAPVSPVSTARPRVNSISSRSIRTMSRIDRRASMRDRFLMVRFGPTLLPGASLSRATGGTLAESQLLERLGDVGALVLARLKAARFHKAVGVLVPFTVGKVVSEHGSGGLRLADDADRHIRFGQPR